MILNTGTSSVEVIGDITEFKTGIDPKNIEFITTLLSSNLYSNPEQSFLREIVSNAWDSHVEAGNTETPVLIKINNNEVTIRDFGIGLSPERFKEVYCNIGSSTKRESNDYIGAFGIGHLSVLSCSNTAYVTSYYNGKAYQYITVKDGNTITNNLVCVLDTTEPNGLEVSIKNVKDISPYCQALHSLVFFPNIYVEGDKHINNCKIRHFNNFAASTLTSSECLLLGNVLYPIDTNIITFDTPEYKTFIYQLSHSGLAIKFNIGELEVTPNRENIIYNNNTISIIKQRIMDAYEEMLEVLDENICWDFHTLEEAYKASEKSFYFDFVEYQRYNLNEGKVYFSYYDWKKLYTKVTYKGQPYSKYKEYNILRNNVIPGLKGVISTDKVFVGKTPLYCDILKYARNNKIVVIPKDLKLTSIIKEWLLANYPSYAIVTPTTFEEYYKAFDLWADKDTEPILREMYDSMNNNAIILDLDNNKSFKEYREKVLKEREQNSKNNKSSTIKNVHIYYVTSYGYKSKHSFSDSNKAIEYLSKKECSFIFKPIDECNFYNYADLGTGIEKVEIWTASKPMLKILKESNLPQFNKSKYANRSIVSRAKTIYPYYNYLKSLYELNILPNDLQCKCLDYIEIVNKFKNKGVLNCNCIPINENLRIQLEKLKDIYFKIIEIQNLLGINNSMGSNLDKAILNYYLFKNKILRINYNCYKETINHPLIKMLCKK